MRFASLVALTLALAACGEGRHDVREWRPSDHQPPPEDPSGQPQQDEPPQADQATVATMLWQTNCTPCHGAEGHGDGPSKPPIAQIPNMADQAWQSSRTDEQIARTIYEGHGMMPAFGSQIQPAGIGLLVMYVRAIGGRAVEAPPDAPPPDAPAP